MAEGWGVGGWGGTITAGGGGSGGGGGDPAPTATNFDPPAGTPITPSTPISFDVTWFNPLVAIVVSVRYAESGVTEVVYNRNGFSVNFATYGTFLGSERTVEEDRFHFVLRRRAGWPGSPIVEVEGADTVGAAVVE